MPGISAGGLPALMKRIEVHLHLDALTVTGKTVGENIQGAQVYNDDVIRPLDQPVYAEGALAVLKGNLAPDGCVIKPSAMSARFLKHSGPAVVFDDYPTLKKMLDDEHADFTEDHVIVLRNAGPKGGPGMPEWGMVPIPVKLLQQGVRDMLRVSDARMSGTSYGVSALHVAPEAYIGGNLALVRTGDIDLYRRAQPHARHAGKRRRAGTPARAVAATCTTVWTWLRLDVQRTHPEGRPGLRHGFPANAVRRICWRTGHFLNQKAPHFVAERGSK